MRLPENKKDVQRFLGMTNYLSKFIPKYSEVTTPIRETTIQWSTVVIRQTSDRSNRKNWKE